MGRFKDFDIDRIEETIAKEEAEMAAFAYLQPALGDEVSEYGTCGSLVDFIQKFVERKNQKVAQQLLALQA